MYSVNANCIAVEYFECNFIIMCILIYTRSVIVTTVHRILDPWLVSPLREQVFVTSTLFPLFSNENRCLLGIHYKSKFQNYVVFKSFF